MHADGWVDTAADFGWHIDDGIDPEVLPTTDMFMHWTGAQACRATFLEPKPTFQLSAGRGLSQESRTRLTKGKADEGIQPNGWFVDAQPGTQIFFRGAGALSLIHEFVTLDGPRIAQQAIFYHRPHSDLYVALKAATPITPMDQTSNSALETLWQKTATWERLSAMAPGAQHDMAFAMIKGLIQEGNLLVLRKLLAEGLRYALDPSLITAKGNTYQVKGDHATEYGSENYEVRLADERPAEPHQKGHDTCTCPLATGNYRRLEPRVCRDILAVRLHNAAQAA